MNGLISVFFLILILFYAFRDTKISVLIYIIGTFVAPIFRISGIELSFDVWCFPVILVIYLFKKKNINVRTISVSLVPYFVIYLFLSLMSSIVFNCGISIATIYATIRFIMTINIVINLWDEQLVFFVDKALGVIVLVNVVCAIVQMMNIVPVEMFYDLYYKESMKPLLNQLQIGYFNRAYGTTGSPVILAGISVLTYTFYLSVYVSGKYDIKKNVLKIVACIVFGILALSKTAILAIPIITIYIMLMCTVSNDSRSDKGLLKIVLLLFFGGFILTFIISWMGNKGFAVAYYLKFLTKPLEALVTRYNGGTGKLAEAMSIIKENFLFGVGHATFNGTFIWDSLYIVLLYQTGVIGLIAYLYPYIIVFFRAVKRKNLIKSSMLIVFFLIAVGNSIYVSYWVIPFVAIMFADSWTKQCKKQLEA